jgi:hypothetical protein
MLASLSIVSLLGCTPEVGTDAWCQLIEAKPVGERTFNETGNYAKHCIIK